MSGIVRITVIFIGYIVGIFFADVKGLIAGGTVALVALILVDEVLFFRRNSCGLWLRHRGRLLRWVLLTEAGVILYATSAAMWPVIIGMAVAHFLGAAVESAMGWSYPSLLRHLEIVRKYSAAFASAANADGTVSVAAQAWIIAFAREKLMGGGPAAESEIEGVVDRLLDTPLSAADAGASCSTLNSYVSYCLQKDLLSFLFSDGDLNTAKLNWLGQFQNAAGWDDWGTMRLFRRNPLGDHAERTRHLGQLGLEEDATAEDVRKAHRVLAKQYDPDRQDGVAAPLREMIAENMAGINAAFEYLQNDGGAEKLFFQTVEGHPLTPAAEGSFDCQCWLCGQTLRIQGNVARTARCSKCFALAGSTFEPNPEGARSGRSIPTIARELQHSGGLPAPAGWKYAAVGLTLVALGLIGWRLAGEMTPFSYDLAIQAGGVRFNEKNYPVAIECFTRAIELKPDSDAAYWMRGRAWAEKLEFDIAIMDYNEAIRIAPMVPDYHLHLGIAWGAKGSVEVAIQHLDRAIVLAPKSVDAHRVRAFYWHTLGEQDKALGDLNEVIRIDYNDPLVYPLRSKIWLTKKVYKNAIADLREAIRVKPKEAENYRSLSWLLASCPDPACRNGREAVAMANVAIEKAGASVTFDLISVKAVAHAEAGDFDVAVAEQQKAVDMIKAVKTADPKQIADYEGALQIFRDKKPLHQSP